MCVVLSSVPSFKKDEPFLFNGDIMMVELCWRMVYITNCNLQNNNIYMSEYINTFIYMRNACV